jgi:hypothetical protein
MGIMSRTFTCILSWLHTFQGLCFPIHVRNLMFSAGKGGMSSAGASSDASVGRFQAGLLSLGSMHAHFGHVNQAMQVLSLICLHTADSILLQRMKHCSCESWHEFSCIELCDDIQVLFLWVGAGFEWGCSHCTAGNHHIPIWTAVYIVWMLQESSLSLCLSYPALLFNWELDFNCESGLVLVEHTFNEDEDYPWSGLFCFSNFKETLQNNDDSCLVHALAALCHLLSEVGTVADSSPKNSCVETVTLPGDCAFFIIFWRGAVCICVYIVHQLS